MSTPSDPRQPDPRQPEPRQPEPRQPARNDLVAAALSAWGAGKNAQTFAGVLRQCAAGDLLLDGTASQFADPSGGPQPGDTLAIGTVTDNAGKSLLVAFTSHERLSAYHHGAFVTSFAQPAAATLAQAREGYDGIVIDPGSPDMCIAYSAEITAQLTEDPAANSTLKSATIRGDVRVADLPELLGRAPEIFIAVAETLDANGTVTSSSVPTTRGAAGEMLHPAFTSPAEVFAWEPSCVARRTTVANVARVALDDGYAGIVVNPAGPSLLVPAANLGGLAT